MSFARSFKQTSPPMSREDMLKIITVDPFPDTQCMVYLPALTPYPKVGKYIPYIDIH